MSDFLNQWTQTQEASFPYIQKEILLGLILISKSFFPVATELHWYIYMYISIHLLLHACMCTQSLQSCQTLCNTIDCSPPGFSVHGILQARILEWITIPFSRGSSWPRAGTLAFCNAGRFFTLQTTRETPIVKKKKKKVLKLTNSITN